jgi:CRP-like cAMP-binding protein
MLMRTSSQCANSRNHFLTHLSRDDAGLLDGLLEWVTLQPGAVLLTSGAPPKYVYFPITAIVSLGRQVDTDHFVETAVVGCEGIVGWSAFSGAACVPYEAIVQMDGGTAWRISQEDIARAGEGSATLLAAAMRFGDVIAVQMAQAIISLLRDPIERRLCRWLLMRHDRLVTDQLRVRHEEISRSLGTRRASVTDCLHILEGERLVRCRRGRVMVRDRQGLEQAAAGSYGSAETFYRENIGPFGRGLS